MASALMTRMLADAHGTSRFERSADISGDAVRRRLIEHTCTSDSCWLVPGASHTCRPSLGMMLCKQHMRLRQYELHLLED
mmetsp:Transcript_3753/g.11590  ORF Transcript_3753/g.11590 Transcript_3753/m.11590 type:complete len:80 (-) Transcript_3753:95-334(-)